MGSSKTTRRIHLEAVNCNLDTADEVSSASWFERASKPATPENPAVTALIDLDKTLIALKRFQNSRSNNNSKTYATAKKFSVIQKISTHTSQYTFAIDPQAFQEMKALSAYGHKFKIITTAEYPFSLVKKLFAIQGIELKAEDYINQQQMKAISFSGIRKPDYINENFSDASYMLFDDRPRNQPKKPTQFTHVAEDQSFPSIVKLNPTVQEKIDLIKKQLESRASTLKASGASKKIIALAEKDYQEFSDRYNHYLMQLKQSLTAQEAVLLLAEHDLLNHHSLKQLLKNHKLAIAYVQFHSILDGTDPDYSPRKLWFALNKLESPDKITYFATEDIQTVIFALRELKVRYATIFKTLSTRPELVEIILHFKQKEFFNSALWRAIQRASDPKKYMEIDIKAIQAMDKCTRLNTNILDKLAKSVWLQRTVIELDKSGKLTLSHFLQISSQINTLRKSDALEKSSKTSIHRTFQFFNGNKGKSDEVHVILSPQVV